MAVQRRLLVDHGSRQRHAADRRRSRRRSAGSRGRHSIGTPNSRHSSASQVQVARFIRRGARGGGDVGGEGAGQPVEEQGVRRAEPQPPAPRRRPPAARQEPGELARRRNRGRAAGRRAPASAPPAPAARSRSITSAVRLSCQTMTGDSGSPRAASQARQLSPWLSRPSAADRPGRRDAGPHVGQQLQRIVLDPARPRMVLPVRGRHGRIRRRRRRPRADARARSSPGRSRRLRIGPARAARAASLRPRRPPARRPGSRPGAWRSCRRSAGP